MWILGIVLVLVLLGQCVGGSERILTWPEGKGSSRTTVSPPRPAYDGSAYAASILSAILEGFPGFESTADACATGVGWVCAIDRIESPSERTITVTLKPQPVWISMADTADRRTWGEQVARRLYYFVDATGIWTSTCWQNTIDPPKRIVVYQSNGDVAFLSPPGFPRQRPRHLNAC
jgi:hypothetical protein